MFFFGGLFEYDHEFGSKKQEEVFYDQLKNDLLLKKKQASSIYDSTYA
jgi:hypothetical protein